MLKEFESNVTFLIPQFGSIFIVTGVCSSTPHIQENVATLFIRDNNLQKAVIKIVIVGCESNKHEIDILLKKINTNMYVGVKGRVEKLAKEDDVVNEDCCKMFKLVINDSDDHALFAEETKPPMIKRQLLQLWWPDGSEIANSIYVSGALDKASEKNKLTRLVDQILQYVVAFKNSFDGEIFVEIIGGEVDNGKIRQWCEKVSTAIGCLKPEANEGVEIWHDIQEAYQHAHINKCFVCVLPLCNDSSRTICWIHVPKGEGQVYYRNHSDVYAFKRVGATTVTMNYANLSSELKHLADSSIDPVFEEDEQDEKRCNSQEEYTILDKIKTENQHREFKMIFGGNPVETIRKRYLARYACAFLNLAGRDGGKIFFGVQEDKELKIGHIVGVVLQTKEREDLREATVKTLTYFYPPVSRRQYHIKFHSVRVPSKLIVKDTGGNSYIMIKVRMEGGQSADYIGRSEELGTKLPTFIQNELKAKICSAVVPIGDECFFVVATEQAFALGNLTELVKQFVENNSKKFELQTINETELNTILKTIYVMELNVTDPSLYRFHMTRAIDTHVFIKDKKQLCLSKLTIENLMHRFKLDSTSEFNIDKFLKDVNNFSPENPHILVASPFHLPENERDLYGLGIPNLTLIIDLDQQPGHLYQIFSNMKANLKTPQDSKLDCWLAVRENSEDENSLPEASPAEWNERHRSHVKELLKKNLKATVKASRLNVIVLWDEGHQTLVEMLRAILKDVINLNENDSTVITFVCATPKASSDIRSRIIVPFQESDWNIICNVHVASPFVLTRFLSLKLPSPYCRAEDDYQVPHRILFPYWGSQIIPQILPEQLRQKLSNCIEVMYLTKVSESDEQSLNEERRNFFSGSAITNDGLHDNIAIQRKEMHHFDEHFKTLSRDNMSHVSYIIVKADRGAGSTTMCLQFLYKQHRFYPCAQLIEIKNGLVSHIEEMNKKTKLPLILFVDTNIAFSRNFFVFKKDVESRSVKIIFILIQPADASCDRLGQNLYKVELSRGLDENEKEQLVKRITKLAKGKEKKLLKFKEKARRDNTPRTFAHFSLLAFGSEFKGLEQYVKFRLTRADERQKIILAFLSLTHVYTDYSLPASALARFLNKKKVILEKELDDKYLQELLSLRAVDSDSRRISSHEVAKEILKQLSNASSGDDQYWTYIKDVSVTMARHVLSKYITTKEIDRLTRKLFVTGEHESENFSQLIRTMRDARPDTARDTLNELVEVFDEKERHSSMRAHLRAHLAKYRMIQYNHFVEAKTLIEAAIDEQKQDSFLHHIHGDIIRLYVLDLLGKMRKKEDMEIILSYAEQSSKCFKFVRSKRPHMSHGYIFDARMRIAVIEACIKLMGGENFSFVDYLIERIDEIKESDDEDISRNLRYLLSLISDTHECLDERCIDFDQKEEWKKTFLCDIGDLTRLFTKLEQESSFIGSAWLPDILVQTQILHHALEIEKKVSSRQEIEFKNYNPHSKFGNRLMKLWIRYSHQLLSVPNLQEVEKRVDEWRNREASPQAEFY